MPLSSALDALLDDDLMTDRVSPGLTAARITSGRLFRGVGVPLDSLNAFGRFYIDTATGIIYEKAAPLGSASWVARWTLVAPQSAVSYVFADVGELDDQIGTVGAYALAISPLTSCSLGDAMVVGPKLAGSGSPGTWTGATQARLSTVATAVN